MEAAPVQKPLETEDDQEIATIHDYYEGSFDIPIRNQSGTALQFLDWLHKLYFHPNILLAWTPIIKYFKETFITYQLHHKPKSNPFLIQGWKLFKTFLSRIASDFDFILLEETFDVFMNKIASDNVLSEIGTMWLEYLEKCQDGTYRSSQQAIYRGSTIIEQTQKHLLHYYCNETKVLLQELQKFLLGITADTMTEQMIRLTNNIINDIYSHQYIIFMIDIKVFQGLLQKISLW
jgi:hypothetical protein